MDCIKVSALNKCLYFKVVGKRQQEMELNGISHPQKVLYIHSPKTQLTQRNIFLFYIRPEPSLFNKNFFKLTQNKTKNFSLEIEISKKFFKHSVQKKSWKEIYGKKKVSIQLLIKIISHQNNQSSRHQSIFICKAVYFSIFYNTLIFS